ncbi:MAG: ATP-binding cassette domain-containing protein [Planctomycetota bacterium]|nr:MAG: ATP-binding cassette domain-containing protein [Planctomycetota bacterium]
MALITLTGVSKAYDPRRPLLERIDLVVGEEDRIGLIGPNGHGKSTLLRILAGREQPDAGERVARRGLRIGFLEQEPVLPPEATVREAVRAGLPGRRELLALLEELWAELARPDLDDAAQARLARRQEELQDRLDRLGGHEVEHRIEAAIDGLGLTDPDARCSRLSGGEARRAALARLLVGEPDLLLLDEPTNHLDAFVVAWLEERLLALRRPLVLVSHDRWLLDRVADRIVEIDRGRLFATAGGYRRHLEERAARLQAEEKTERSRLNLLRRETAWMKAGAPARSTKARARIRRFQDLAAATPTPPPDELELAFPPGPRLGARVLELRGVSHAFAGRTVLPPLDLRLEAGMRLGVVGPNGAGKTTLLRILLGRLQPDRGERMVGETVRLATIDQLREDLDPDQTVLAAVAGAADHVGVAGRAVHASAFLDRFLFPGRQKETRIRDLSGGERGRVLLARLMIRGGNVLILDEPTNDLDLPTLRALEEALVAFPGAVVVVSHDRWFLDRVATHLLHLDGRGGVRLHAGDFRSLLAREAAEVRATPERSSPPAPPRPRPPAERPARLSWRERRELEELLERIDRRESELAAIDAELGDPETYRGDPERIRRLRERRRHAEESLAADLARWEELASREEAG